MSLTVGVLALQGDVSKHQQAIEQLGYQTLQVRKPQQLEFVDALVLPGGESTAIIKLMWPWKFIAAIQDFSRAGKAVFGTCAGAILLANEVRPSQERLSLMDIEITRNAYGSQLESFTAKASKHMFNTKELPLVFIRAPKITRVGEGVDVLVEHQGDPVMVRQGNVFAATFHPEMTGNQEVYREFLATVDLLQSPSAAD